ncbi:hypothetical protein [Leptospira sp. GIMC2001]|uniref:hypothetical protein n=1 Tax=Leptospira sp. GIMC2001 TaxID=1513297 RepID=UPI00234AB81E|nr:hypothetical protein [Leptospira sp. GIMC2001]WCL48602.1 hypothetical protein O4O04_15005 [Leptospira sp. GIMC2001]
MNTKYITITNVKAKWFYFPFLLRNGYTKSIPEYKNIEGLESKYYQYISRDDGRYFGGIYEWSNLSSAKNWFNPDWFQKVKETRGYEGKVGYYKIISRYDRENLKANDLLANNTICALFVNKLSPNLISGMEQRDTNIEKIEKEFNMGSYSILRIYTIQIESNIGGIFLLTSLDSAKEFANKNSFQEFEIYETPVII